MSVRRRFPLVALGALAPRLLSLFYVALVVLLLLGALLVLREQTKARGYVYGLLREMARVQMLQRTQGWRQMRDDLFIVRYREDEPGARLVQETGRLVYARVYEDFAYLPDLQIPPIPVVIYPSRAELNASFGWPASESAMGVYWQGVIRVLAPRAWVNDAEPQEMRQVFQQAGPMAHELSHLLLDYAGQGNFPRWFTEGLAQYQEYKITGYSPGCPADVWSRGVYPLREMDQGFDKLADQNLAYRESLSVVEFIVAVYGEEGLHKIIKNLARGINFNEAVANALALDGAGRAGFEGLEREWRDWLAVELQQPLLTNREEQP